MGCLFVIKVLYVLFGYEFKWKENNPFLETRRNCSHDKRLGHYLCMLLFYCNSYSQLIIIYSKKKKPYILYDDFSMCIQLCNRDVTFTDAGEFRNRKKNIYG